MVNSVDTGWNNTRNSISNYLVRILLCGKHGIYSIMYRFCFYCEDNLKERIKDATPLRHITGCLRFAASRRLGLHSARSIASLIPTPHSGILVAAVLLHKPSYAATNIVNSQNVMCNVG
jgi:hypothetical protein